MWRLNPVHSDLRCAMRSLRKAPYFALSAIVVLASGFGACVAVLGILDAIYLSELPFPKAEQLVGIDVVQHGKGCANGCPHRLTPAELAQAKSRLQEVAQLGGAASEDIRITTSAGTTFQRVGIVSGNLLDVLGVRVARGRGLTASDDEPGAAPVVLLSQAFWKREFAGDTSVLGTSFIVGRTSYRVVGILPDRAIGHPITVDGDSSRPSFLAPAGTWVETVRLRTVARLREGVATEALRAHLLAAYRVSGNENVPLTVAVTSLRALHARQYAGSFPLLLAGVVTMLVVVTANFAGLFLARLSARHDIAVRAALGAGLLRSVRPVLLETAFVTLAGALLGMVIAVLTTKAVQLAAFNSLPYWATITISGRTTAAAVVTMIAVWTAFGLLPALYVAELGRSRPGTVANSAHGNTIRGVTAARKILIGAELAIALALTVVGGLLVKTYLTALWRDTGIDRRTIIVVIDPRWDAPGGQSRHLPLAEALSRDVRALRGVEAVGVRSIGLEPYHPGLTREGDYEMLSEAVAPTRSRPVTMDYFRASGLEMLYGRQFAGSDVEGSAPVVILGDSAARRLFGDGRAVGRRLKFGPPASRSQWMTVVGVVREEHCSRLLQSCPYVPRMFRPASQGFAPGPFHIRIRVAEDPERVLPAIRKVVGRYGSLIEAAQFGSVDRRITRELARPRLYALVTAAFALFAAALSAFGIYAVMAYVVSLRRREIATRIAVGASAGHIRRLMLSDLAPTAAVGLTLGGSVAWAVTRMLGDLLYGSSPDDPWVFGIAGVAVLTALFLGTYKPLRLASSIVPSEALRPE